MHEQALLDILGFNASASKDITGLIRSRLKLLGRQTGYQDEIESMHQLNENTRMQKFEDFLQENYNLKRAEAARIMDEAMAAEETRHGIRKRK